MIILDTDCLSLLDREKILEASVLLKNLNRFSPEDIFTTIISFEEQMRGWMALIAKGKTIDQQIFAYQKLHRTLESYRNAHVLEFDQMSAQVFKELKSQKIRVGTMDLKIASIAISNNAILVSRNLSDFEQVPNLAVQDWTK